MLVSIEIQHFSKSLAYIFKKNQKFEIGLLTQKNNKHFELQKIELFLIFLKSFNFFEKSDHEIIISPWKYQPKRH